MVLHVELAKLDQPEETMLPDSAPQPMIIYADTPPDPVGFRLGDV